MAFRTLISPAVLGARLGDPQLAIIDCRFKLDDPEWGEREYRRAHIPSAVYAHLDRDLSGTKTGLNGRHPLPSPDDLRHALGRMGISSGVQAVAYDQNNGMFASRFWWLLRWLGHETVAVLDGGFDKWTGEGRPVAGGTEQSPPRVFSGTPRMEMVVDAATVDGLRRARSHVLVDARAPERFRGEIEPLDRVPGHIPSAINHFYGRNVDEAGTFHTPEELRRSWRETLGEARADRIVCYCGSGVTACHDLLALEHAGLGGAVLYAGSWSEWCADPSRPVEK